MQGSLISSVFFFGAEKKRSVIVISDIFAWTAVAVYVCIADFYGCTEFNRKINLDFLGNDKITFSVYFSCAFAAGVVDDCGTAAFHRGRAGDSVRADGDRETYGGRLRADGRTGLVARFIDIHMDILFSEVVIVLYVFREKMCRIYAFFLF